jgi:hypothetical protein
MRLLSLAVVSSVLAVAYVAGLAAAESPPTPTVTLDSKQPVEIPARKTLCLPVRTTDMPDDYYLRLLTYAQMHGLAPSPLTDAELFTDVLTPPPVTLVDGGAGTTTVPDGGTAMPAYLACLVLSQLPAAQPEAPFLLHDVPKIPAVRFECSATYPGQLENVDDKHVIRANEARLGAALDKCEEQARAYLTQNSYQAIGLPRVHPGQAQPPLNTGAVVYHVELDIPATAPSTMPPPTDAATPQSRPAGPPPR